jgi:hypothetical protein
MRPDQFRKTVDLTVPNRGTQNRFNRKETARQSRDSSLLRAV